MKIGFDISQTGRSKAGCGYFAHSLVHSLAAIDSLNEYLLYPTFGDFFFDPLMPAGCPIQQKNFHLGLRHLLPERAREFWRNPPEDYENRLGNPDIIHANNFFCPRQLKNARLVYTLYDLNFLERPEWGTEQNRTGCFDGVFHASVNADCVVAISEASRDHFLRTFPHYPKQRTHVLHLGSRYEGRSDEPRRPANFEKLTSDRFWLSVGTIEPRKNHRRLLEAYAIMREKTGNAWPLVLAGGNGWLMESFDSIIDEMGLAGSVIVTGYVDDEALYWLYRNCYANLYPTLFEGFGLPVLEGMGAGAATIASNSTSVPEIVGEAGLLVDPLHAGEIALAMQRLLADENLRAKLKSAASNRARLFSWQSAAEKMLAIYREVGECEKFRRD